MTYVRGTSVVHIVLRSTGVQGRVVTRCGRFLPDGRVVGHRLSEWMKPFLCQGCTR